MKTLAYFVCAISTTLCACSLDMYADIAFTSHDGRVPQAFLDSINQALSLEINGDDLNAVQLKQRRALGLTERQFASAEGWQRLCSGPEGKQAWKASQCMAFAPSSPSIKECDGDEWCLQFTVAPFIEREPRLMEIVRHSIVAPCTYARTQKPVEPPEKGGRSVLPPGEARLWLRCDSAMQVFGRIKNDAPLGAFLLSINRN